MQAPECPICSETYNRRARCPKVLQCGHTFCNGCLSDWEIRSLNGIECPRCRRVERRTVVDIPQNYDTLEYLEAHIDPRFKELVRQNNGLMAQSQTLLDDCRLKKLPVLEDNKKKIDDFNRQIIEVIQIIEQFRDSVNANYEHITSQNQASLQPYIDELQNYVNTTATSIRQANQLIEDFDADYNQLQDLFKNHTPTLRVMLERFNVFGSEKLKNLKQIVLQLNTQDPYPDPRKASLTISIPIPNQSPNPPSGPSYYPAAGPLPYSIPIPGPNPTTIPAPHQMPTPVPNKKTKQAPYQIPNQAPYQIPNPTPNPIPTPVPNKIPNQAPYQIPNPTPNPTPNPIPNSGPNLAGSLPKQHKEQWQFHNIREKRWIPFDFHHNQLIIDAKLRGVKDVIIRLPDGKAYGTVKLDKMKFYLSDNMWYPIESKPIE